MPNCCEREMEVLTPAPRPKGALAHVTNVFVVQYDVRQMVGPIATVGVVSSMPKLLPASVNEEPREVGRLIGRAELIVGAANNKQKSSERGPGKRGGER